MIRSFSLCTPPSYIIAVVLFLTACESKEAKYERLNREVLIARLAVSNDSIAGSENRPVCPDIKNLPTNEYLHVCSERVSQHSARLAIAESAMNQFLGSRSIPELDEAMKTSLPKAVDPGSPPLAVSPCSRPRPYKNWSNEELNAAQVEYMGTPQSQGLINEAACRLSGR